MLESQNDTVQNDCPQLFRITNSWKPRAHFKETIKMGTSVDDSDFFKKANNCVLYIKHADY